MNTTPKGRTRRSSKQKVENSNLEEHLPPIATMADQRTMAQLLQAPTEGYEDAIVVPEITADNFELKHGLLTLVQNKQFYGHDKEDHHAHIRYFNKITATSKFPNVPNTSIKLMLFPFSLEGASRIWLEKEPPRSILTWDDLVSKFINQFFPPSKTTNLRNEITRMVRALLLNKKGQNQPPAPVKAVEESYVICGGWVLFLATRANIKSDLKAITIRSGVSYDGPSIPPLVVENKPEATKDTVVPTNNGTTEDVQTYAVPSKSPVSTFEPANTPISALKPNPQASIPYPSRRNDERNQEKAKDQMEKFYQVFKDMSFEISFADALILMPKFASTLKDLIGNKEKLSEMARTPLNEHCYAVLLKKIPNKLGNPGKFLIPCDFPGMAECLALADLDASINLMPYSVWKKLSLPDLTPTSMTLELTDRSISRPVGVAEDVYVKVGSFHFPAYFVVVDFDADPRVPLILGRSFLKTERALIDVFEEYSQEVLGFSDTVSSGNPTPFYDSNVSANSLTLSPFGDSDFLLEEVDAFLAVEDEPISSLPQSYLDPEGDILLLEAFLNDDPSPPLSNQRNYLPEVCRELKIYEAKTKKSSVDEPPMVELKALPPHLEYAFLEGDDKLPVIIAKELSVEEKAALITVLKSHKRAITWKLFDIKGIKPKFCNHKILLEEDFTPAVQHQRRVNPKIHDVIKQEKGGFTVVENEENELIPTRLVMGWRVCIDYRKLNEST
uniref:Reverse transcriptase domain-containing protein n=1 Tax=Tanacetum cinerariifolium TaxID=118510 RepID=A0A6L2J9T3_TANCI|nr:reverse transcriptase domain-containing protein [Tanacetum cinerariifolium]